MNRKDYAYSPATCGIMKASLLVFAIGLACALGYPVDDVADKWELVPTADGRFKLVNIKDLEFQEAMGQRADFPVRFFLYTRSNPTTPQEVITGNGASLSGSYFSAGRPTRIVTHGWRNDANSDVGMKVRNGYLNRGDFNVFVVDWSQGASSLNYITAKDNVVDAGRKVAAFMDFLNSYGQSSNNIYLIGHSLGAHVSGMAGKYAKSRPNTIFGLDAALPLFSIDDPSGRLAVGDAGYVETIHTDSGRLGFDQPIGQASFYPAWGTVQPGCGIDASGACSHGRSYDYFSESLSADNQFLGRDCGEYSNIQKKSCTGTAANRMGGEPSNPSILGNYYVLINSASPYATGRV